MDEKVLNRMGQQWEEEKKRGSAEKVYLAKVLEHYKCWETLQMFVKYEYYTTHDESP
jgi:hypothetical protein